MEQPAELGRPQDRYGAPRKRLSRRVAVGLAVGAIALAVVAVAWIAFVTRQPVSWQDAAFKVNGDTSTTVTFDVTMAAGKRAVCTVRALNSRFTEVGAVDVGVGPSSENTIRTRVRVPTSELAVTGTVKACVVKHP